MEPTVPELDLTSPVDLIAAAAAKFGQRPSWDDYFMATAVLRDMAAHREPGVRAEGCPLHPCGVVRTRERGAGARVPERHGSAGGGDDPFPLRRERRCAHRGDVLLVHAKPAEQKFVADGGLGRDHGLSGPTPENYRSQQSTQIDEHGSRPEDSEAETAGKDA